MVEQHRLILEINATHSMLYCPVRTANLEEYIQPVLPAVSFLPLGYEYRKAFQSGWSDGRVKLGAIQRFKDVTFRFPTPLVPRVLQALLTDTRYPWKVIFEESPVLAKHTEVNVEQGNPCLLTVVNRRKAPKPFLEHEAVQLHGKQLRDYQQAAVDAILFSKSSNGLAWQQVGAGLVSVSKDERAKFESGLGGDSAFRLPGMGILHISTGGGKTVTSASLIGRSRVKSLFLVYGNDLVLQTHERFQELLGPWLKENHIRLGLICEKTYSPEFVTVGAISSLLASLNRPQQLQEEVVTNAKEFKKLFCDHKPVTDLFSTDTMVKQPPKRVATAKRILADYLHKAKTVLLMTRELRELGDEFEDAMQPWLHTAGYSPAQCKKLNTYVQFFKTFPSKILDAFHEYEKIRAYLHTIELLIFDEAHRAAADNFYNLLITIPAYYRIGMSGTPLDRGDQANLKVVATFGEIVSSVTTKELVERGILPNMTITMLTIKGKIPGYKWQEVYQEGVVDHVERNTQVVMLAEAGVRENERSWIFFKNHEHGDILNQMFATTGLKYSIVDGRSTTEERQFAWKQFIARKTDILISSAIFGTGMDLPEGVDRLINAGGGKDAIPVLQQLGRGLRGQKDVKFYDFMDEHSKILKKHSMARLEHYVSRGCFETIVK